MLVARAFFMRAAHSWWLSMPAAGHARDNQTRLRCAGVPAWLAWTAGLLLLAPTAGALYVRAVLSWYYHCAAAADLPAASEVRCGSPLLNMCACKEAAINQCFEWHLHSKLQTCSRLSRAQHSTAVVLPVIPSVQTCRGLVLRRCQAV